MLQIQISQERGAQAACGTSAKRAASLVLSLWGQDRFTLPASVRDTSGRLEHHQPGKLTQAQAVRFAGSPSTWGHLTNQSMAHKVDLSVQMHRCHVTPQAPMQTPLWVFLAPTLSHTIGLASGTRGLPANRDPPLRHDISEMTSQKWGDHMKPYYTVSRSVSSRKW